ncbi:MAG: ABC transporter ATP-binding protein [Planctomycetota bacterium]
MSGLSARYGRGQNVLHDVEFEARTGAVTALLGPNGSGKSTLLRAVCGLVPYTGEVHVDGEPARSLSRTELARRVAFVPQNSQLQTPLLVKDVVQQGRFAAKGRGAGRRRSDAERVERAMELAAATPFRDRPFTALSGGERQRVLLARALATGASTLLLDEPTSAQDVRHGLWMGGTLRSLAASGVAVVVVLHDIREVRTFADHAFLLSEGCVVRSGTSLDVTAAAPIRDVFAVEVVENGSLGFTLPEARTGPGA